MSCQFQYHNHYIDKRKCLRYHDVKCVEMKWNEGRKDYESRKDYEGRKDYEWTYMDVNAKTIYWSMYVDVDMSNVCIFSMYVDLCMSSYVDLLAITCLTLIYLTCINVEPLYYAYTTLYYTYTIRRISYVV